MFIIDKAGRKILLLTGFIGMCLFSFGLALARIFAVYFNLSLLVLVEIFLFK
jgi:hypothetical protein